MARRTFRRRLAQLWNQLSLDDDDVTSLTGRVRQRRYAAGQVILLRGTRGDCLGLVAQGQVVADASSSYRNRPPILLKPGALFGESMFVSGHPSSHTYRALTDARVYYLRRRDLLAIAGRRQSLGAERGVRWLAGVVTLLVALCALWAAPGVRKAAALAPYSAGLWLGSRGFGRAAELAWSRSQATADWSAPHLARGNLYFASGHVAWAEQSYASALALDPGTAEALNGLGLVHAARGDQVAAIGFYQRALEIEPGQSTVLANLAYSQQHAGELQAALRAYALARSVGAPHPAALVNEAIARYVAADPDAAEAAARAALTLDPWLAPAHTVLAAVRLDEGQPVEAQTHLRQALKLDPGYAPASFLSGLIAKSYKMRQTAIDAFERVLQTTDDPTTLHQAQVHLDELYAARRASNR